MFFYLIIVNIISFILYGIDKICAINRKRRISEYNLLIFSFFGGSIGSILGMVVFRHKILKLKFWFFNFLFFLIFFILLLF